MVKKIRRESSLKLDLNENPYGRFGYSRLDDYERARKKIAFYARIKPNNVALTNGSSHALEIIFSLLFSDKDAVLLPVPNFVFYTSFEKAKRLRFIKVPYQKSWSIEKIVEKLKSRIRGVYISNPNNPVGYLFSPEELKRLILKAARNKALVIIDEAYFEFSGATVKNLVKHFSNLIIVRTLSKAFGLAGLRAGYIIASRHIIKNLEELIKKPLTIGRAGLEEIISLGTGDVQNVVRQIHKINRTKKELADFLKQRNIKYYPSSANFLTIKTKNSKLIADKLKSNKILVNDLNNYADGGRLLKNCIRVTIPRASDLPRLKKALDLSF